jgi:hypothetical protein
MHLLVPFAQAVSDEALPATPQLQKLLSSWAEVSRDEASEQHPAPPHERVLARALGWPADAPAPWAARQARSDGIEVAGHAWGLLTPAHWRLDASSVHLADPQELALDEASSRALLAVLQPWFEEEGFRVAWGAPLRWYAAHPSLASLQTASLDRVIGRNVDVWLPPQGQARLIRRLQNEVQMLLYEHPLNVERQARGLPAVNSFWLSGCGAAQAETAHDVQVDARLRAPVLAQDVAAWRAAWVALDARVGAGGFDRLTLCGERAAATLAPARRSWWQRWAAPKLSPQSFLSALS